MNNKPNKPFCPPEGDPVRDIAVQAVYAERVRELLKAEEEAAGHPLHVYIETFGCQQNEADSERLLGSALSLGYQPTEVMENADLILFNTCAVREHAELRALSHTGALSHLKKKNKSLLIGLCGCMVTQEHRKEDIKMKYPYVDFVAGTSMLHRLPEILCDVMESGRRRYYLGDEYAIVEGVPVKRKDDKKALVSIMYGCNNFCTYCVVPYVRGRERSRERGVILDEVKGCLADGYREIMLLGQNVNSYGKDGNGENGSFASLLADVASLDGDFTVRFMTSHPKDASDELIDVIASHEKVARHFHLPMQSGSTEILKRMNRRYTAEQYAALAEKIKARVPGITLTTDIIVGFPGETEQDFEDTLTMMQSVRFDSVYAFIFSPRIGTPAYSMEDTLTHEEKAERMNRLLALQTEISSERNHACIGRVFRVLCENDVPNAGGFLVGRSSCNRVIFFTTGDAPVRRGDFMQVKIYDAGAAQLFGRLCE